MIASGAWLAAASCAASGFEQLSAVRAGGARCAACYNSPSVYFGVALKAKRQSIGDVISKLGMMLPCFDVMGVQLVGCAALLASVIIAVKNGASPLLIFVGGTLIACGFGFVFSRRQVAALPIAILGIQMSVLAKKLFPTSLAHKRFGFSVSLAVELTGARQRACLAQSVTQRTARETLSADWANSSLASPAPARTRIKREKFIAAILAPSKLAEFGNVFVSSIHECIVTHIQRWADATGKTPELING